MYHRCQAHNHVCKYMYACRIQHKKYMVRKSLYMYVFTLLTSLLPNQATELACTVTLSSSSSAAAAATGQIACQKFFLHQEHGLKLHIYCGGTLLLYTLTVVEMLVVLVYKYSYYMAISLLYTLPVV